MDIAKRTLSVVIALNGIFFYGCTIHISSSSDDYKPKSNDNNLLVHIVTDKNEDFETTIDISNVSDDCSSVYLGKIESDELDTKISLSNDGRKYVSMDINMPTMEGDRYISYGTLLTPKKGFRYEYDVIYSSGSFDLALYEINKKTSRHQEVETVPYKACKKL